MPKLLIVDDNHLHLEVLKVTLEAAGHTVLTTTHPAQVSAMALEYRPDVIMSDINMPGTDGFELTRQLKASAKTKDITVLLFSSVEKSGEVFRKALEVGAEDFIKMPAENDEITARLDVCIARRKIAKDLAEKIADLERFQAATIDREKRVLELKEEIRTLRKLSEKQG